MAYLTIDVGGTFLKSALLDKEGIVYDKSDYITRSFSDKPKEKILQAIYDTVNHSLQYSGERNLTLAGIGIATPGPFNYEKGIPLMEHKFHSIYGISLREFICNIKGVPPGIPVCFIHDANAVLAGELWKGNAAGFLNAAAVTLGTGLGFAFCKNRVLQFNNMGGPLITIFKIPYKQGILEDYTSIRGFLKIYSELSGATEINNIKVSDIGKLADKGNTNAIQTFHMVSDILVDALKLILKENNIQCLLFGGQISRSFHHMEDILNNGLKKEVSSLMRVSVIKSIDHAALLGALKCVLDN